MKEKKSSNAIEIGDNNVKITNEKPVSLNPVSFEDALRGLLSTPLSDKPKAAERESAKRKKPVTK